MNRPPKRMKYVSVDEFLDFEKFSIVDQQREFPKPKKGKIYRSPYETLLSGEKKCYRILSIETEKDPLFDYAYPPKIKTLHFEEIKVFINVEQ